MRLYFNKEIWKISNIRMMSTNIHFKPFPADKEMFKEMRNYFILLTYPESLSYIPGDLTVLSQHAVPLTVSSSGLPERRLALEGLQPATTYHLRVTAASSAGTTVHTYTFTTLTTRGGEWETCRNVGSDYLVLYNGSNVICFFHLVLVSKVFDPNHSSAMD